MLTSAAGDQQRYVAHSTVLHLCRRALDLVYALINKSNIEPLTAELLDYLSIADIDFKADLVAKICQLSQQYAPNKRWHFDTILKVIETWLTIQGLPGALRATLRGNAVKCPTEASVHPTNFVLAFVSISDSH